MKTIDFLSHISPYLEPFSGKGRQQRIAERLSALKKVNKNSEVTPRYAAWILLANACAPSTVAERLDAWIYEAGEQWERDAATPLNWLAYILSTPAVLEQTENIFIDQPTGQLLAIFKGGKAAQSEGYEPDEKYIFHNVITITAPALQLLTGLLRMDAAHLERIQFEMR